MAYRVYEPGDICSVSCHETGIKDLVVYIISAFQDNQWYICEGYGEFIPPDRFEFHRHQLKLKHHTKLKDTHVHKFDGAFDY
jgi:hypothetical protein